MKNGLIYEAGELVYYKDDKPKHAGVIQVDGALYYISSKGRAVKGRHVVHGDMANGILKRGTYTFGEDYKLVEGSYIAPKKRKGKHTVKKVSAFRGLKSNCKYVTRKIKKALKIKNNQTAIAAILAFVLLFAFLPKFSLHNTENEQTAGTVLNMKIILPVFEEDVLLCSEAAKREYDGQIDLKTAAETGDPYRPFVFQYHLSNASGVLLLGETEDLANAREFDLAEDAEYVTIDNLMVDTTYYYEVRVGNEVYPGSFHTAPSTRFVYIPGLVNTRDIGGGKTLDGKKVRQGMLIRGVELDGLGNASYFIPEEELEKVQETFGFQFDLDLRESTIYNGQYTSRLGVEHKFYTAPMYGGIFAAGAKNSIRNIFSDLADPEKYPIYLHCTWGQDRTGTMVFLLQGILNMSEEDMIREYRLTSYVNIMMAENSNMDILINGLMSYEGDTLQEKIVSFMTTSIGVTEAEIQSIRSILLED